MLMWRIEKLKKRLCLLLFTRCSLSNNSLTINLRTSSYYNFRVVYGSYLFMIRGLASYFFLLAHSMRSYNFKRSLQIANEQTFIKVVFPLEAKSYLLFRL